ncbi:hypothetical protein RHS01_05679 [Rhizoctonia solani]|uniref:F-box domain-containing protein n=1 Tax=Rhizoctonia solani TaxID=456999 RepID=A0A8H7M526_9AGAM|nr:hypothetical protein RHS01_05679 [Rhizoctonia solani]
MHVLQLPVDILIAIFSHLTASRDLYSCNQICRAVHNLFRSSPQLYHKLSLARASLADTLYGVQNKSLQDRTRLVLELEQRWWSRALSSRRQLKIPLDNPCIEYQICNGVIVTGVLSSTGDSLQELQVYRLPSYLTGLKSKLWRHKLEKDSSVRQLKVDPSQDLLVLTGVGPPDSGDLGTKCTVSLHLRTLSTNDSHPAASLATLSLKGVLPTQPFMHPYSQGRIVVRICQDILGVLTNPDSTDPVTESSVQSLVIWQWTSGQQLLTLPQLDNLLINDLTFLGRHTILLTHSTTPNGPGISVLHLALGQPYANSPVTSTAPMNSLETSTFFHFPSPPICSHECIRMGSIKITSEPPIDISWPALEGKNHVPRVFTPDPSEATSIVAFSLSIYVRAFGSTRTNTIKHTLLTRASVFSTCTAPYSKRSYTFDEWSSEDTYWFSGEPGFIHGQRYTLTSFQQPRTNVEIYDFNHCHAEIPDSGWFALLKEGNSKLAHGIVPKLSAHRTRCGHKRYLDSELKSTMHCKRQCMKAGLARLHDRVISALDGESVITIEFERGGLVRGLCGMPGPRNKPKNKKKKGNKGKPAPSQPTTNTEPSPPPQSQSDHAREEIPSFIVDPGTGPRVRDLYAFLTSPFAAPPTLDDPVCDWFFDSTTYAIIEQLLPQELSLILHYNRTRLVDKICPACRRFYRLGDLLPFLAPEPGSIDELDREQEDSRALHEQQISGLCSFVCFSLACFNYPGARGAWGRTAELLDPWTTELLNGPGAGIPDHGMSDLVKMTRNHDLGIGYMISKPWPGAPVLYEFDEDVAGGDPAMEDDEDELWAEESPYSSDSEPRGRERSVKPLGASRR